AGAGPNAAPPTPRPRTRPRLSPSCASSRASSESGDMTANGNGTDGSGAALRIDKWLFFARFFKSRSLAATLCAAGKVRVNRQPIRKAHHALRVGDVLTFPQGGRVRVVRVAGLGVRRGPAEEARL